MAQPILPQQILLGILSGVFLLAAAIVALIGVIWRAVTDFKTGKRTGDIAQQTADDKRMADLEAGNAKLRTELDAVREKAWATEQTQRHQIAEQEETIVGLTAQLNIALRAQERAEGGLVTAERAIKAICPPSETNSGNCPPESSPPEQKQEQS